MSQSNAGSDDPRLGAVIVKVEEWDREGRLVHEGEFGSEFADREAAVAEIELHLRQFVSCGRDVAADFWWGRSSSGHETRFLIK